MATPNTPTYLATGSYVLTSPFTIDNQLSYTCKAIRSFEELAEQERDVFALVYSPVGLTKADMANDQAAGASIITLYHAESDDFIYVPDTYIAQFPTADNVPYSRIVLALEVGPLPDTLDLTLLTDAVIADAGAVIGVTPTATLVRIPTQGIVSQADHEAMEAIRAAAVTRNQADYVRLSDALIKIDELTAANQRFVTMLIEAGIITV